MDAFKTNRLLIVAKLVVVITRGGSGFGETMALPLDTNGADTVFILERRMASLQNVATLSLHPHGSNMQPCAGSPAFLARSSCASKSHTYMHPQIQRRLSPC